MKLIIILTINVLLFTLPASLFPQESIRFKDLVAAELNPDRILSQSDKEKIIAAKTEHARDALFGYTSLLKFECDNWRKTKKNVEISEVLMSDKAIRGRNNGILILLEKNGKRRSERQIRNARKKALKELTKRASNKNATDLDDDSKGRYEITVGKLLFSLEPVIESCELVRLGEREYLGREVEVLGFSSCSNDDTNKNNEIAYLRYLWGKIYVDKVTKVPIFVDGFSILDEDGITPVLEFRQTLIGENKWAMKSLDVKPSKLLNSKDYGNRDWRVEFYDYKEVVSDVEYKPEAR